MSEPNAGWSTCPVCDKRWLVTPQMDCLIPACGCFGHDTSEKNNLRPCEPCGMAHAHDCPFMPAARKEGEGMSDLAQDLERAISAHLKSVGDEVVERAVASFRARVEEEVGAVTVRVLKQVRMESLVNELLIHVKVEPAEQPRAVKP